MVLLILAGCTTNHPLVGRWKTTDSEGYESVLFFKADGTFEAITKGENLPGNWIFHEDREPHQLELIFEENRKVITIAKLVGDQLMIEPIQEDAEIPTRLSENAQKYRRQ